MTTAATFHFEPGAKYTPHQYHEANETLVADEAVDYTNEIIRAHAARMKKLRKSPLLFRQKPLLREQNRKHAYILTLRNG